MEIIDLSLDLLREAPWNPNHMVEAALARLQRSVERYGIVAPQVVRAIGKGFYEVVSGNQKLQVYREMGLETAPCVIVDLDDAQARLLAQALNHIHGEDDLGLRAELLRTVLEKVPEAEVLQLLPESATGLQALVSLGQEDLAEHLQAWQHAQQARLRHFHVQLTEVQLGVVEEAFRIASGDSPTDADNPNQRGNALAAICRAYLKSKGGEP